MKEQDIRSALADKLRIFRTKANLTAREVGDAIGKSAKTVSGWEHGRGQPDADVLFSLCKLYGIASISEFYPEVEPSTLLPNDLSEAEKQLLYCFQSLNKQGQQLAIAAMKAFVGNPDLQKE